MAMRGSARAATAMLMLSTSTLMVLTSVALMVVVLVLLLHIIGSIRLESLVRVLLMAPV